MPVEALVAEPKLKMGPVAFLMPARIFPKVDCDGVSFASGGAAASACCALGDRLMESLAESPGASPDFCGAFVLSGADCGERPLGGAVR